MTKKDLYSVLGVDPKASTEDIKKAYRSLAKQWHPDKNKAPHAEEHFKEIGNAYQTLVDSSKRRTYDLQRDVDSAPKPSQSSRSYTYTPHSSARTSSTSGAGDNSSKPKAHSWYTHHSNSFFSHHSKDGGDTTGPSSFSFRFESRRPRTSSFSDFRRDDYDEDSPTAKANKNSSNFEKKKPKRKSFSERPEWNNNWNDDPTFDTDSAFEMPFGGLFPGSPFESYTDTIKMFFTNLLGGSSSAPEFSSTPRGSHSTARQPRNRQHRNASHRGHSNSNLEDFMDDDMWNWKKPMFSKNDDNEDDTCFGSVDSDSDSDDMLRLECNYCGVKYHASILINHERYCRRKSNPTRDRSGMDILHDLMRNHHRSAFNPGHASNTKEHCPWCGRKCSLDEAVEHVAFCTGRPSQRPFRNPTNNTPPPPRSSTSSTSRPTSANTTRASATSQQQQPRTSRFGENNSNTNRTYWHTPRTSASFANASNASTAGGANGTYSHKKGSKSYGQGTSTTIPPASGSSRMGSAGVQGRRFSSVN